MSAEDKFRQPVVNLLGKRAAFRCSNPDCGAVTSGPSLNVNESINVGEAAHIFGANPGSARYDPLMLPAARSAISNAIWLCGNCHKMVDDDQNRYPAGLLFEWQKLHESLIANMVGKAAVDARARYEKRHLDEIGKISYLAERLVIEKGFAWEYLLTAEMLNNELSAVLRRWRALEAGLYMRPALYVQKNDVVNWFLMRIEELRRMCDAFNGLINSEFAKAWGAPGIPGIDIDIIFTCRLYGEMCKSALFWEESVRSVGLDTDFEGLKDILVGVAGRFINEAAKLPDFISQIFSVQDPSGMHELKLVIDLPEGWSHRADSALKSAFEALAQ